MSASETQRGEYGILRACSRCGQRYETIGEASVCCLFAPQPTGWCAWCGTDVPGNDVFCGPPCAFDHASDLLLAGAARRRAPSPPS